MFSNILPSHPVMMLAVCAMAGAACGVGKSAGGDLASPDSPVGSAAQAVIVTTGATTTSTPIGLAVRIEQGVAQPLSVRAGQTFYVNQIDMRVLLDASVDEGISGLKTGGDFATLNWQGVELVDQSAEDAPNPDGTYTGRGFYRHARWMDRRSTFTFVQVDAKGAPTAPGITVDAGTDNQWRSSDAFFVRRLRAIQWTLDCASRTDCTGAQSFQEEALVELRDSLHPEATFQIRPATAALQVVWSQNPGKTYTIPLQQIASRRSTTVSASTSSRSRPRARMARMPRDRTSPSRSSSATARAIRCTRRAPCRRSTASSTASTPRASSTGRGCSRISSRTTAASTWSGSS